MWELRGIGLIVRGETRAEKGDTPTAHLVSHVPVCHPRKGQNEEPVGRVCTVLDHRGSTLFTLWEGFVKKDPDSGGLMMC